MLKTTYASVLLGTGAIYGAVSLMNYSYRRERDNQPPARIEELVPGLTAGVIRGRGRVRQLAELNLYYLHGGTLTVGAGVQVRLGNR